VIGTAANLHQICATLVDAHEKHAAAPKSAWNACHASGRLLASGYIYLPESEWCPRLVASMASLLTECKNYKVRIEADPLSPPRSHCYPPLCCPQLLFALN
jgi:hypothetical protein